MNKADKNPLSEQGVKFQDIAQNLNCDEDEEGWEQRLRQIARPRLKDKKKPAD
ncbi:hypothetical protein [Novosphingobium nitrogenifigens]|uniref:hypothetical protein n=1 Tax=Novosphingobium nitrogenifigens TaxID=378548 RepID=UPI0012FBBF7A|nr:hypothetical protein [Novosphingobium nitrogenifigens]